MKLTFEGRDWQFDESAITVRQGIVIHLAHGITIAEFSQGLLDMDARALQAGYWLMLQQAGVVKPIAECDFKAVEFAQAYATARVAELEEERAREARAAEAAIPEVPTPPAQAGGQPYPAPGCQPGTTQPPYAIPQYPDAVPYTGS